MFNPLSSSPFSLNPGLAHQPDIQSRQVEGASVSDRSVHNQSNATTPARQSYSLSERFSRDDSFSISLTTQDGDQVEITFNSETSYKSDYAMRSGNGFERQRYSIDKEQSSEFGFSVEGNLDVEEIDAIAALVQDLSSLASNFFNGDLQTAMQQAGDLSFDSGQLATLDVSMEQSMEYRAIEKYREIQSMGEKAESRSERAIEPFREQLQNQISRTELHIEYAAEFTFNLIAEFISHDQRFKEMSEAEQESLKANAERLGELASVKTSEAEDAYEENEHDSDDVKFDN